MTRRPYSDSTRRHGALGSITNLYETENGVVIEVRFKSKEAMDEAIRIERAIGRMLMGDWADWDEEER